MPEQRLLLHNATGFHTLSGRLGRCRQGMMMNKAISAFLLLAMLIQIIRPLGLPGLRRRSDFWKLAVVAFVAWSVTLLVRP
jgi:hypothetical protein